MLFPIYRNRLQQQNFMRKRVLFQAVAIVLVILILVVAGGKH